MAASGVQPRCYMPAPPLGGAEMVASGVQPRCYMPVLPAAAQNVRNLIPGLKNPG